MALCVELTKTSCDLLNCFFKIHNISIPKFLRFLCLLFRLKKGMIFVGSFANGRWDRFFQGFLRPRCVGEKSNQMWPSMIFDKYKYSFYIEN